MERKPRRGVLDEMDALEEKRRAKKKPEGDDDLDLGKVWS